jgi:hypothetical protein
MLSVAAQVAAALVLYGGVYVYRNYAEVSGVVRDTRASIEAFYVEHLRGPIAEIWGELVGGRRGQVADAEALVDAQRSLAEMLANFNARLDPNTLPYVLSWPVEGLWLDVVAYALVIDSFACVVCSFVLICRFFDNLCGFCFLQSGAGQGGLGCAGGPA